MYTTRIDRKLSAMELQSALFAFNAAFRQYLNLLTAEIACRGSSEGEKYTIPESEIPMIFQNQGGQCDITFGFGLLVKLHDLGIDSNILFSNMPFKLHPTHGIILPPLNIVGSGMIQKRFFAVKLSPTPADYPDAYDYRPLWSRPIDKTIEISQGETIPPDFIIAPEIIVKNDSYSMWGIALETILKYRLAPLNPLVHPHILLPEITADMLIFPEGNTIRLYESRLGSKIPTREKKRYPLFTDAIQPLRKYQSSVRMILGLVDQEITRRKGIEYDKWQRKDSAKQKKAGPGREEKYDDKDLDIIHQSIEHYRDHGHLLKQAINETAKRHGMTQSAVCKMREARRGRYRNRSAKTNEGQIQ